MASDSDSIHAKTKHSIPRLIGVIMLSWLLVIGIDFFLHAGVLARVYAQPSPFLLLPSEAFRRIPLGYFSFLLLNILIYWLMLQLKIATWGRGMRFGLAIGALIWAALTLGLLSISTASPVLMLGWFAGQTIELGAAGTLIGAGLSGKSLRRLTAYVIMIVLALMIATIVLQNTGLAPTQV